MILYGYKHFLRRRGLSAESGRGACPALSAGPPTDGLSGCEDPPAEPHDPTSAALAEHPNINAAVLAETAKLHAGDPENRRLWQEFLPFCEDEIERMYRRLDVTFDHTLGESFYEDRLAAAGRRAARPRASPARATARSASSSKARRRR